MNKVEIPADKSYRLINPGPAVLLSTFSPIKPNVMTLAWCMNISDDPHIVGIAVGHANFSYKLIIKYKEFAINIPDLKLLGQVASCGAESGKDTDKFRKNNLRASPSKFIKPPLIEECMGNLECRTIKKIKFDGVTLFIAKVLRAVADKKLFKNSMWDTANSNSKLLHHLGSNRFEISGITKQL